MSTSAYSPWSVRFEDFPASAPLAGRLRFLLNFAVLAPSSHNSQPWKFWVKDNRIIAALERGRLLAVGDDARRQAIISLGCAIENLLLAAERCGFEGELGPVAEGFAAITLSFRESGSGMAASRREMADAITHRMTNRGPYDMKRIPDPSLLAKIIDAATPVAIRVLSDEKTRAAVADLAVRSGISAMESNQFRHELSEYILSNYSSKSVGMTGATLGIPGPVSLLAPYVLRFANMSKASRAKDEKLLRQETPVMIALSTPRDDASAWIEVGRAAERLWLAATAQGLSVAPLAAMIEQVELRQEFARILGISEYPQFYCRLGYAVKRFPHSPRLSASSFF